MRNKLTQLQSDPNLATRAPVAVKEADAAVTAAEITQPDKALAAHRVYMANRKVDTASALAESAFAEDQRTALTEQREKARLDARTREADTAKNDALLARAESAEQKLSADSARSDADAARLAAMASDEQAMELKRQIEELQAKETDRGIVLTLGDVLFTSGMADLKSGTTGNLNKLVTFLNGYPTRTVVIEGYTDSVGTSEYNDGLVAAASRCREDLPDGAGRRIDASHLAGQRRERSGRRQRIRRWPPAKPPRRSDHQQSAGSSEVAVRAF